MQTFAPFQKFKIVLCCLLSFHVIAQQGSLDPNFLSAANFTVNATCLQSNNRILIGGDFTTVNGATRNKVARLNEDGTLDTSFDPGVGPNSGLHAIGLQSDQKIIIAGAFTTVNGVVRPYIARLFPDGSLDASFQVPGSGVNNTIVSVTVQPDDKILIAGLFTAINGVTHNYLARLNADGSVDASFLATGGNDIINHTNIQPDGKIIIAGSFTTINGMTRSYVARLNADGSVDAGFNHFSQINNLVYTSAILSNGQLLIGGNFTAASGMGRDRIARLNSNGTLDTSFDPIAGANGLVTSLAVQSDGKIVVGGVFNILNNTVHNYFGRLNANGTIDNTFDPQAGANNNIQMIKVQNDDGLILVGGFTSCNNTAKNNIARIRTCDAINYSEIIEHCGPYTWNGQTYASSGTYSQQLYTVGGCDSVVTLQLTVHPISNTTETAASCGPYVWPLNGQTYAFPGTFKDTLTSVYGCDSIVSLQLLVYPLPNPTVVQNGDGSFSTPFDGQIEWIDCTTGQVISIDSLFVPTQNGSYALIVTNVDWMGCSDTSECMLLTNLNTKEIEWNRLECYPNPSSNSVTITWNGFSERNVEIWSMSGQFLRLSTIKSGEEISLFGLDKGMYWIKTSDNGSVESIRIIKE